MKTEATKYAVPALDKGLDILEYLSSQDLPRSQAEIAIALKRSANEIYRILVSLEHRGYLHRDEVSGKYRMSLRLYHLSRRIDPVDKVRQCALPHMEDLAFSSGHSCYLTMLYQSQTMVVIYASSHSPISIHMAEGTLLSTLNSCSGRVLLAHSNDDVRTMILERDKDFSSKNVSNKTQVIDELDSLRDQLIIKGSSKYITSIDEHSTLVGQSNGTVIAALTVSVIQPSSLIGDDLQALQNQLLQAANKITLQLGL